MFNRRAVCVCVSCVVVVGVVFERVLFLFICSGISSGSEIMKKRERRKTRKQKMKIEDKKMKKRTNEEC